MTGLLIDGPDGAPATLALAHGAGAGMDHPFLQTVATGLAAHGLRVARFEFPYMERRRAEGRKRGAPDRPAVLLERWRQVIGTLRSQSPKLLIGGKSMGGRIASMLADEERVDGLVCLGYPFHPPGRPDKLRTAHLETLATRTLIVQGTRDAFGSRHEVPSYPLSPRIRIAWIEDGDHSLEPRKRSGRTYSENLDAAIRATASFVDEAVADAAHG